MRKVTRAEEQHTSLNFRTADAEQWGQKEHFRVVDSDTPLTEGGSRCEGCGGPNAWLTGVSVCRNRACNKRDKVIHTSKIANDEIEKKSSFDERYVNDNSDWRKDYFNLDSDW
jgi:hypothetical protein